MIDNDAFGDFEDPGSRRDFLLIEARRKANLSMGEMDRAGRIIVLCNCFLCAAFLLFQSFGAMRD
jgi:hypothetical protein